MKEWRVGPTYTGKHGFGQLTDVREGDAIPGSRYVCSATPEDAEQIISAHNAQLAATAADGAGQAERMEATIKEAWRFWADITGGFPTPTMLDRGYVLLRAHPERLAAFDALFRTSRALEVAPPAPAEPGAG